MTTGQDEAISERTPPPNSAGVVVRAGRPAAKDAAVAAKQSSEKSASGLAVRSLLWTAVVAVGLLTLATVLHYAASRIGDAGLAQANEASIRAKLAEDWPPQTSADYLETLSELALQIPEPDVGRALLAARRAVEADPSRAFAWATIAYVESLQARTASPQAIEALGQSMDACPLCSADLVRWRLNFVLTHWSAIPDPVRRRAFDHADMLRWLDGNGEFLGEMQIKAERAGLPFAEYRSAVNTPLRSWDLDPVKGPAK